MSTAYFVVVGYVAAVVLATWFFFRLAPPRRPWIGVINLRDVALLLCVIAASPYPFVALPGWGAAVLLSLIVLPANYFALEAFVGSQPLRGAISLTVVLVEIVIAAVTDERSNPLLLVNGVVLALLVVAVASLLAQSGMRARDVAVLAGGLALYEIVASSELTLIPDLMERAGGTPFLPLFGWWQGSEDVAIGLGELLVAATFPLVARKAFGVTAGRTALVVSVAAIAIALGFVDDDSVRDWLPMAVLGPLILLQYGWWMRRRGRERRMSEYLREDPRAGGAISAPA